MISQSIQIRNLSSNYKGNNVLNDLNVEFEQGEICCILGKNGAGKTTLLKCILGVGHKTGEISILGEMLNRKTKQHILQNVGVLMDKPLSYDHLTVWENLKIVAELYDIQDENILNKTLKTVALYDERNKQISYLSSGMKQRLGLALACVHSPQILILDEPTNTLDPQTIAEFRNLIKQLNTQRGLTVIYTTHNLDEAFRMSTRIIILKDGMIVFDSRKKDIEKLQIVRVPKGYFTQEDIEAVDYYESGNTINIIFDNCTAFAAKLPIESICETVSIEDIYLAKHRSIL